MSDATITVRSPYDQRVVGEAPSCSAADVDRAVKEARHVLVSAPLAAWKRAEILDHAAHALDDRREAFARTIAAEAAKPLKTARVEAQRAVSTFTFAAVEARRLAGVMVPMDAAEGGQGKLAFTLRLPIGVVGGISPFNFPLNLVAHKVAPALAAGCPLVLKPASQTPLSALALRDLLVGECGLPEPWLQVVTGPASEVGRALVDHPEVAMISFTGSAEVGWSIRQQAPRKKVGLELGNNSPVIIEADGDWSTAATKIAVAGFSHAGQSCISTQRVYAHEDVLDDFLGVLVAQVERLVVGDPLDENTDVSSLITPGDRDRVQAWIEEGVAAGGEGPGGKAMPYGLLPMLAVSGSLPRDDAAHAYEVKWDGVRVLSYVNGPAAPLRLQSRNAADITPRYPELEELTALLGSRSAIVDGEVIAFDRDGRPSFGRLQHRMHVADPRAVRQRMVDIPVSYIVFDLLWLDGRSLMEEPYTERRAALEKLGLDGASVQVPASHVGGGAALLEATRKQGLEGVVGKRL